jgi:hypothetical protein
MVTLLLTTWARAAPVVCDDLAAAELLAEARIEEARAPLSHPELIPGLALASPRTDAELRTALTDFCADRGTVSLAPAEQWASADWSAHSFLLTHSEMRGCMLYERTLALSVGVKTGVSPKYSLRDRLPLTRTPVGDCAAPPAWRDEEVLAGSDGPVRLVLVRDHEGDVIVHSEIAVRRATAEGWTQQVLVEPAPERLLGGDAGAIVELTERYEEKWVVQHGDRTGAPPACAPISGQTVWTPGVGWQAHTGRDALQLLAARGLWRLAGEDGWFLIVAQDDEEDAARLALRTRRLQKRTTEPLHVFPSAWFPGLNAGFLVVTPPPWPTEAEAEAARDRWGPRSRAYVKLAWEAPDPCAP